ncbi:MAG: 5-methyltetrahydropteroyltriglutamate--homocysteine methyltransferase [Acetobacteraceae bacterium]|nr:5-methyltetrahydropteroyltriglutamate--homocysteine methyltransferase [Acetobacteraceae bacterium]MSP29713.1 5-methyltetrahydropteroyltriglutamate--homocysteine methyltransferase [Acetobacteraceae bacterium]
MMTQLIPTTVVGSYPQPDWLVDRTLLSKSVARVHMHELWRVAPEYLEQAQDDATILAIRAMESAGIDIITDGEVRRESYSNRFALSLAGIDADNPGVTVGRMGNTSTVPRIVGKIAWQGPVEVRNVQFLRANTDRVIKITLPGPFTMAQQAQDDFYRDAEACAMDYAAAVNAEAEALKEAGADVIQLDEPWLQAREQDAARYGVSAINRALEGIVGPTIVHLCFGYAAVVSSKPSSYSFLPQLVDCIAEQISIEVAQPNLDAGIFASLSNKKLLVGVLDLGTLVVESAETVAGRLRDALRFVAPEHLIAAPDCGMKYLPRDVAYGKLCALVQGAAITRRELTGEK